MKTKKFLILSVLVIMAMFMTGCSHDITNEFKGSQKVAEDFLTTKGYEAPKGYEVRYVNESEKQLCVNVGKYSIVFDIIGDKPEMRFIEDSEDVSISKTSINEIKEVGQDFLNTAGYHIPKEYSIKYLGDKKKLEVSKQEEEIKIIVTFDILEDEIEISEVNYYKDESSKYLFLVYVGIIVGALTIVKKLWYKQLKYDSEEKWIWKNTFLRYLLWKKV